MRDFCLPSLLTNQDSTADSALLQPNCSQLRRRLTVGGTRTIIEQLREAGKGTVASDHRAHCHLMAHDADVLPWLHLFLVSPNGRLPKYKTAVNILSINGLQLDMH